MRGERRRGERGEGRGERGHTSSLHLLRECDHIRRMREVPILVSPEFACCSTACLHLVDDERDVESSGEVAEALEEEGCRMVVATCYDK